MADDDKDGKMNSDEYVNFQHPEETKHMEELAVDEILEDVDQDGDGWGINSDEQICPISFFFSELPFNHPFIFSFITVNEFIGHYGDAENAPHWVEREREEFARQFDKNKDGKLNRDEVRDWALPQRGESLDEAKHLIDGADDNADGVLSVEEILVHWEFFVGSKATDHGETLRKMTHVEL